MPQNLHILQVEQEVVGDDISVLNHVLSCDIERLDLMKELAELSAKDTKEMEDEDLREAMKDRGLGTPATRAGTGSGVGPPGGTTGDSESGP